MPELTAKIRTKKVEAINKHRDPRQQIYFIAELYLDDALVAEGGIWSQTEQGAIESALERITVGKKVRTDYEWYDYDNMPDAWGQLRVLDPEDRERLKALDDEFKKEFPDE